MYFAVVGLTHKEAPIEIRERISFTEAHKIEATDILMDMGFQEIIILSTCNRSEIYFAVTESIEDKVHLMKKFFEEFFRVSNIDDYLFAKINNDAIEYLYSVCAGLDSIVLGEDQILGQVKDALMNAMELGATSKYLNKLFREAITTAKKIKSNFKISQNPLSISYIGVKFIKQHIPSMENKTVVIIGAGKMGKLAVKHLVEEGVQTIYCCNRSLERFLEIQKEIPQIQYVNYDDRYQAIEQADILISATNSSHTVIHAKEVAKRTKPLLALDLALPRDIEPSLSENSLVQLYDIDHLQEISSENRHLRMILAEQAKLEIEESIEEFLIWSGKISVDPTIESLQERCQEIERDTLSYIYRKLMLNSREKKIIEKMLHSALKRIVKNPILLLKETNEDLKREEYKRAIEELFDLN